MAPAPAVTPTVTADAREERRVVRSLVHASGLLKALHKTGRPTSLSDLARKIKLSKPATYVLLKTLEASGLITQNAASQYELSWGLYELGSAVIRPVELVRAARMHLDHLAERTGEMVLLGILDHGTVLYLDRGQADASFVMIANAGRRSPLHATASGKVLLAYQDADYIASYARGPLVPTTSLTITDPSSLLTELGRVRERGYATCGQEQEIGLCSVAVPVMSAAGMGQAALAIAAPQNRFTYGVLPALVAKLKATSKRIAVELAETRSDTMR